jgi:hypothetical protein
VSPLAVKKAISARTLPFTGTEFQALQIHHWFRSLKARANKEEWSLIHDITFHDLRHDFAHRPAPLDGLSRRWLTTWGT